MRFFIAVIISLLCATACSAPALSTSAPAEQQVQNTPTLTSLSLGECVDARRATPAAQVDSLFPIVDQNDHILGNEKAFVTILVYSDFQCVSCAQLAQLLKSFVDKNPDDLRVVFRHFPLLSIHDKAALSVQAVEAAHLQGKFWEMHDLLFAQQSEWQDLKPAAYQPWLIQKSAELGLDPGAFESDLTSPAVISIAQSSWEAGQEINLPGAPIILLNNEIIKWQSDLLDQLENYVKLAVLTKKQFSACPPVVINLRKSYTATLKTSKGNVKLKLFVDKAPNTVNNFIFLAREHWFDNSPFHRVVTGFIAQTGDPTGTGLGGPGYFIPSETNNFLFDRAGMLAMVNSGADTNGSQFFITMSPAPHLNQKYPIFGEVISGLDVLIKLNSNDPANTTTPQPMDTLITVIIEEK